MKIILIPKKVIESIPSDEVLSDSSIMESLYTIRLLKALAESLENGYIDVNDSKKSNGQVYSDKYEIWFQVETFI